jgi:hypothetical protein
VVQVPEQVQVQDVQGVDAPPVRWEPCEGVSALDELGLCAGCGWPEDGHGAGPGATGAVVIAVPRRERPRLRRAS